MLIENVGESGQAGVQMQMDGESKEVVVVNGVVRWDVDEMGKCWRVGRVGGERDGLCIGAVDFGAVADLTTLCDSDLEGVGHAVKNTRLQGAAAPAVRQVLETMDQ